MELRIAADGRGSIAAGSGSVCDGRRRTRMNAGCRSAWWCVPCRGWH